MWHQGLWLHNIQLRRSTEIALWSYLYPPATRKYKRKPAPRKVIKSTYQNLDSLLDRLAVILADGDPSK
jgi:hypothetical protein